MIGKTIHSTSSIFKAVVRIMAGLLVYSLFTSLWVALVGFLPQEYYGQFLNVALIAAIVGSLYFLFPDYVTAMLAFVLVILLTCALTLANAMKAEVTSFPLSTVDLEMILINPFGVMEAVGAPRWGYAAFYLMPISLGLFLIWRVFKKSRQPSFGQIAIGGAQFALRLVLVAVATVAMYNATAKSVAAFLQTERNSFGVWEPAGLIALSKDAGILGFLGYTSYIEAAERDYFFNHGPRRAPPHNWAINASVQKYLQATEIIPERRPNIVVIHAEGAFDPNEVLRLATPVESTLFSTNPPTDESYPVHLRNSAIVNIIGGGSWVSEFEVISGIDTRLFGVAGRFSHASLSPFARRTFPRWLGEKGYETTAYTNVYGEFYNYETAYLNYGFNAFFDREELGAVQGDTSIVEASLAIPAINPGAPFLKYILLGENHSPHVCMDYWMDQYEEIELEGEASEQHTCAVRDFVRHIRSAESAIELARAFLEQEKERTGREYVIAVYGDHQPYSFTSGGGIGNDLGINFSDFRRDRSKRRTLTWISSSQPLPFNCCAGQPIPLTLLPTLISTYVADEISDIYLPVNLYQFDKCGSDWIGFLVGTTFYGRAGGGNEIRCRIGDSLITAYQQSGVLENPGRAEIVQPPRW